MSKNEIWHFRLEHILKAIQEIEMFVTGMDDIDSFMGDAKTLRAVERNIEIIGEATAKIPDEIKQKYQNVPWRGMKGMRNAISHGYDTVEYESVWEVVRFRLPELKQSLEMVLKEEQ